MSQVDQSMGYLSSLPYPSEGGYSIYPVPNDRAHILIRGLKRDSVVEVYNLQGIKMMNTFSQSGQIDVSSLTQGIYFLVINHQDILRFSRL